MLEGINIDQRMYQHAETKECNDEQQQETHLRLTSLTYVSSNFLLFRFPLTLELAISSLVKIASMAPRIN